VLSTVIVGIITRFQYDIRLNQLLIGISTAITVIVGIITRFQYDIRLNQLLIGISTAILRRTARPRGIDDCGISLTMSESVRGRLLLFVVVDGY